VDSADFACFEKRQFFGNFSYYREIPKDEFYALFILNCPQDPNTEFTVKISEIDISRSIIAFKTQTGSNLVQNIFLCL
jgi:hypothetical protein